MATVETEINRSVFWDLKSSKTVLLTAFLLNAARQGILRHDNIIVKSTI